MRSVICALGPVSEGDDLDGLAEMLYVAESSGMVSSCSLDVLARCILRPVRVSPAVVAAFGCFS